LGSCARSWVDEIATIQSMDVVLPARPGEQTVERCLRTVAKPERRVAELLVRLGLRLSARRRKIENVVAKTTLCNVNTPANHHILPSKLRKMN